MEKPKKYREKSAVRCDIDFNEPVEMVRGLSVDEGGGYYDEDRAQLEHAIAMREEDDRRHRMIDGEWRRRVMVDLERGDIDGMLDRSLIYVQHNLLETAITSGDEKLRLDASKFVMGQAGRGSVTRVDGRFSYEEMGSDALVSTIRSMLDDIKRLNPNFDERKLLGVVDVESEEVEE